MTDDWRTPPPPAGPPPGYGPAPGYGAGPGSGHGPGRPPGDGPPPGYGPPPEHGRAPGHGPPPSGGSRRGLLIGGGAAAVVLILVVVVFVTQSGDDGDRGGVATGPPPGVTLDDLERALLTLDDLDDRYTVDLDADDGSDPMDDADVDASPECLTAIESMESGDESSQGVSAAFVEADEGSLQHDITFAGPGASLHEVRAAIEQCDVVTFDEEGASGEFRFEVAEFDDLGEDGFAMNLTAEFQTAGIDTGFEMYAVVWTRDGVMSTVTGFAGFDELTLRGMPADRDQVRALAAVADQRLAGTLAG